MRKIILIAVFAITSLTAVAQEKSSVNSKWKETKNGVTYQMEVNMENVAGNSNQKPHISFSINGDVTNLTKVVLTRKNDLYVTVPVSKEAQSISVEAGTYTFQFYHRGLGERKFDVDLKKGEDKAIILTLK